MLKTAVLFNILLIGPTTTGDAADLEAGDETEANI
jgi:hypothetical protein